MKHTEMIPLMGKKVVVTHKLIRSRKPYPKMTWQSIPCTKWEGWIVGFRWKQDGDYIIRLGDHDLPGFKETSRQLCVLIARHPSQVPIIVPLKGYTLKETTHAT